MIGEFGEVKTTNLLFSLKCTENAPAKNRLCLVVESTNRHKPKPKSTFSAGGWNWTLFHEVGIRDDADSLHLLLGMRIAALLPVKSETKDGTKSEGTRKEGK